MLEIIRHTKITINFSRYKKTVQNNSELFQCATNRRCFIFASGPSIKQQDITTVKNEDIIFLNNFYVHPDFDLLCSGKGNKYYMIAPIHPPQTEEEWETWLNDIDQRTPSHLSMLLGLNSYEGNIHTLAQKNKLFINKKCNWFFTGAPIEPDRLTLDKICKNTDLCKPILPSHTVTTYAIIAAIYMGYEEIYLLGADHNQMVLSEKSMCFYDKALHKNNELSRTFKENSINKMFFRNMFYVFSQYELLSQVHSKIYNCSPSSTIDTFDFKDIKNIITDKS